MPTKHNLKQEFIINIACECYFDNIALSYKLDDGLGLSLIKDWLDTSIGNTDILIEQLKSRKHGVISW